MLSTLVMVVIASFVADAFHDPMQWQAEHTLMSLTSVDTMTMFKDWGRAYNREYASIEEAAHKYMVWMDNLYTIANTNSQHLSFTLRLNQFGDMTADEWRVYVHGGEGACFRRDLLTDIFQEYDDIHMGMKVEQDVVPAPDSVDWSTKGVVTPIKNQGQCGSCWAFSTTGGLECNWAIQKGTLNSLSEQQLVDCAGAAYGSAGCNGGHMQGAMRYAAADGGLCTEAEYPYTGRDTASCKASTCGTKYNKNTGYTSVTAHSSSALATAVVGGCVSIGIQADQTAFQHYSGGVLTGTCGTNIDHIVLVVGYGTSGSAQYWKVKNSWGTSWGESGYIRICRNCNKNGRDGECGILIEPIVPSY